MLNINQAALHLNLSVSYLRNLRQGYYAWDGPAYTLIKGRGGQHAQYTLEELNRWQEATKHLRTRTKSKRRKPKSNKTQLADPFEHDIL